MSSLCVLQDSPWRPVAADHFPVLKETRVLLNTDIVRLCYLDSSVLFYVLRSSIQSQPEQRTPVAQLFV